MDRQSVAGTHLDSRTSPTDKLRSVHIPNSCEAPWQRRSCSRVRASVQLWVRLLLLSLSLSFFHSLTHSLSVSLSVSLYLTLSLSVCLSLIHTHFVAFWSVEVTRLPLCTATVCLFFYILPVMLMLMTTNHRLLLPNVVNI